MCITKPKVVEKGIAKIKKNEYQRNIKVMPRGPVPGQNICSLGAGQFLASPLPCAFHAEQSPLLLGSKCRISSTELQCR